MPTTLYTWDRMVTELGARLGGLNDQPRMEDWLNSAQIVLAGCDVELPELDVQAVRGVTSRYPPEFNLQSDLNLNDVLGIRIVRNNTTGIQMSRFGFEKYRRLNQQSIAAPIQWARYGYLFVTNPAPDGNYTLTFDYRRYPQQDMLEISDRYHEDMLRYATYIGFGAIQEPQQAAATFKMLPAWLQMHVQVPHSESEFEAGWDRDLGFEPDDYGVRT